MNKEISIEELKLWNRVKAEPTNQNAPYYKDKPELTLSEALQVLKWHQDWRLGEVSTGGMVRPAAITAAIDKVIEVYEARLEIDEKNAALNPKRKGWPRL